MIVKAYNPEIDTLERTYLSASHAAASTALYVKNNSGFATNKRILIGEMGAEHSEITTSGALTGKGEIATSALVFTHETDDPVTLLEYDQVAFYRAESETGTYTLLQTVDLDVDNEDKITYYDDTTSSTTSWYKIKYVNSLSLEESDFSDPMQATGYAKNTAGKVIDGVVRRVHDPQYTVLGVDEYLDIMNEVNHDLITQTHRPYRFLKTSILIDTVAGQDYVDLPTNLWKFDYVEYTRTIGGFDRSYQPKVISYADWDRKFNNGYSISTNDLTHIAIDEATNRLYLGPTPYTNQTGKIQLHYWKYFEPITSVGDVVETPNDLIYRYKMLAEYYSSKSEADQQYARLANNYEAKYGAEVVKMQRVNRIDAGTPREFKASGYRKRYTL